MRDAFTIDISTGSSAFDADEGGGEGGRDEIARILLDLANRLQNGSEGGGGLYDINGNRVGSWNLMRADD